jgi:RHS repeat-associated protein
VFTTIPDIVNVTAAQVGAGNDTDDFGVTLTAAAPSYGWVGAKQRTTSTLTGLVQMGIRLYNPTTGRFLSIDPVYGGNDNPYTYPADPVNMFDLNGRNDDQGLWYAVTVITAAAGLLAIVPVVGEVAGFAAAVGSAALFFHDLANGDGAMALLDAVGAVGGAAELRLGRQLEEFGPSAQRSLWRSQVHSGVSKSARQAARRNMRRQYAVIKRLKDRLHRANGVLAGYVACLLFKQSAWAREHGI